MGGRWAKALPEISSANSASGGAHRDAFQFPPGHRERDARASADDCFRGDRLGNEWRFDPRRDARESALPGRKLEAKQDQPLEQLPELVPRKKLFALPQQ